MDETDGAMLARLGTDAAKWADEFTRVLARMLSADPRLELDDLLDGAPGGLVHVWFVNAIEAGRAAGRTDVAGALQLPVMGAFEFQRLQEVVQREAQVRECAAGGHPVATTISGGDDDRVVRYICRCGMQSWIRA